MRYCIRLKIIRGSECSFDREMKKPSTESWGMERTLFFACAAPSVINSFAIYTHNAIRHALHQNDPCTHQLFCNRSCRTACIRHRASAPRPSFYLSQSIGRLRLHTANKFMGELERVLADRTILEDISVTLITTMCASRLVKNRIPLHASRRVHVDEVILILPTLSGPSRSISLLKHKTQ